MTRTHAPHPDPELAELHVSLCGWPASELGGEVSCHDCLRLRARSAPERSVSNDPGPPLLDLDEHPAVFGAREMSTTGRRAIAQARLERGASKRVWSSVDAAVRAWVRMRDEGASLRSTCDPSRADRVQTSRDPSLGGREHDAIERTATVARALDRATRDYPLALINACPLLEPEPARSVYLLSVAGIAVQHRTGPTRAPLKGTYWERVSLSIVDVADRAAALYSRPISWRHVEALRSHFGGVIMDALVASGEMRARRPRQPRRGSFAAGPGARVGG